MTHCALKGKKGREEENGEAVLFSGERKRCAVAVMMMVMWEWNGGFCGEEKERNR